MNIVVYTKPNCSYCTMTKRLLEKEGFVYHSPILGVDFDISFIKNSFPEAKTFPVVTLNGVYIGGYKETKEFVEKALGVQNGK